MKILLLICFILVEFSIVGCEKSDETTPSTDQFGEAQGQTTFRFTTAPYKDCVSFAKNLPRFEWTWYDENINDYRFLVVSNGAAFDTIFYNNCQITNCEGQKVPPPLTLTKSVSTVNVPDGSTVTLQYNTKPICAPPIGHGTTWVNYPSKSVIVKY